MSEKGDGSAFVLLFTLALIAMLSLGVAWTDESLKSQIRALEQRIAALESRLKETK